MLTRWRKYRNYLLGRPISPDDNEQIRMIEYSKECHEVELLPWEDNICSCIKCNNRFYVRTVLSPDGYFKIMTPRVFTCMRCGQRVLYFRADDDKEGQQELYYGFLYMRYLGYSEVVDEIDFISQDDPIKYYIKN